MSRVRGSDLTAGNGTKLLCLTFWVKPNQFTSVKTFTIKAGILFLEKKHKKTAERKLIDKQTSNPRLSCVITVRQKNSNIHYDLNWFLMSQLFEVK